MTNEENSPILITPAERKIGEVFMHAGCKWLKVGHRQFAVVVEEGDLLNKDRFNKDSETAH